MTGVDAEFFINGRRLVIRADGYVEAAYTLAPAADPYNGIVWILDVSVLGTDSVPAPF